MIAKMTKYTLLMLPSQTGEILGKIQEVGLLDISRSAKPVDSRSQAMLEEIRNGNATLALLRKIDFSTDADAAEIAARSEQAEISAADIRGQAEKALGQLQGLENALAACRKEEESLLPWGHFDGDAIKTLAGKGVELHSYRIPKKRFSPQWGELYPLVVINDQGDEVFFVVAGEADIPCPEIPVPEYDAREAEHKAREISGEILDCKGKLLRLKETAPQIEEGYIAGINRLEHYLAAAGGESAAEESITILTGFAPTEDDRAVCDALDALDLYYIHEPAVKEDNPPVKLKNNWFARLFETFTGMYGMPLYDEFDPTPVLAPFFLLFWAFCMGDAGYGLLLIGISFLLKKVDIMGLRNHRKLVAVLGVGTFIIGILLGTLFGINLAEAEWVPEWLKSIMISGKLDLGGSQYDLQMVVAIAIGVFHICLAMVIKAVGLTKRFGFKQAISAWGWVTLIIGGLAIAALALTSVLDKTVVKWAIIAVGVVSALGIFIFNTPGRNPLMNIGSGLWDTYNMATGILGDVLSYIRLYALGLAGGMLGGAFNELAAMTLGDSPQLYSWPFFILILLLGHTLNLAMSCLGAFVHPLRLTFVEYFKNSGYEGKGKEFKPLKNIHIKN